MLKPNGNPNIRSTTVLLAAAAAAAAAFPGLSAIILLADAAIAPSNSPNSALHFLALGDWGGREWWPHHTNAQVKTASGMAGVASEKQSSFVLALGDNFYSHGIPSDANGAHNRFRSTFETVYDQPSLDVPWYVCAGNHDHLGNVSAQLMYHDVDQRWNFPNVNHRVRKEFRVTGSPASDGNDPTKKTVVVEIILIDTVNLAGMHFSADPNEMGYFDPLPGPLDPDLAKRQMKWIERHLSKSTADYLIVAGHYPIYSACSHGNTKALIDGLDPLLKKHAVTAYLSGHDHCQLHVRNQGMDYLLTGTGDECCYEASNTDGLPDGAQLKYILSADNNPKGVLGGFASFEAGWDHMVVTYHDEGGNVLYNATLLPRVSAKTSDVNGGWRSFNNREEVATDV